MPYNFHIYVDVLWLGPKEEILIFVDNDPQGYISCSAVVVLAFVFYIFIQVEFGHILKCTAWNFTSDISRYKNSSSLSSHSALRHNDEEVEGTKVCEKAFVRSTFLHYIVCTLEGAILGFLGKFIFRHT